MTRIFSSPRMSLEREERCLCRAPLCTMISNLALNCCVKYCLPSLCYRFFTICCPAIVCWLMSFSVIMSPYFPCVVSCSLFHFITFFFVILALCLKTPICSNSLKTRQLARVTGLNPWTRYWKKKKKTSRGSEWITLSPPSTPTIDVFLSKTLIPPPQLLRWTLGK